MDELRYNYSAMVILIIVLCVLLLLILYSIIAHAATRLSFLEKEVEVVNFTEVRNDFDNPEIISGYKPVIRFEINGKTYQGTADVFPLWRTKENRPLTILYNPENPSEFKVKESSTSPVTGCIFLIIVMSALALVLYFHLRKTDF